MSFSLYTGWKFETSHQIWDQCSNLNRHNKKTVLENWSLKIFRLPLQIFCIIFSARQKASFTKLFFMSFDPVFRKDQKSLRDQLQNTCNVKNPKKTLNFKKLMNSVLGSFSCSWGLRYALADQSQTFRFILM